MRSRLIGAMALALAWFGPVYAQDMDKEISSISDKLSKTLVAKGKKKVASVDFVDLQGRPTELGRFLAEQLSIELVNAEGISVVDRANIKSILDEHKLTEEGLVNPENAKKLGQFAGVDAILIGSVTPLDSNIVLTVKAISTETAEVIAAGKITFAKTTEIQQLLNRGVASSGSHRTIASDVQASSSTANAIATKELGPLRCSLLDVIPTKEDGQTGRALVTAMTCSFELANLDLSKVLSVTCNAKAEKQHENFLSIRGELRDSNGRNWRLVAVKGISIVACGSEDDSSRIVDILLSGNKVDDIYLFRIQPPSEGSSGSGGGISFKGARLGSGRPPNVSNRNGYSGDFVRIAPGRSIRVSLTFSFPDGQSGRWPKSGVELPGSFALETELVLGVHDASVRDVRRIDWRLENLVLDRVNIPPAEGTP